VLGGAVAFAVGFGGGLGVDSIAHTPARATQPAASVAQQPANPAAGVHAATLTSCIAGLGC
jgi:hypothetical protein